MAASHRTEQIRNIAVVGHAGSGKTTLIEALLYKAGAIRSPGSVDRGTTVCDFTDQEKRLKHSLDAAIAHLGHDGRHINLVDTPGYPDFMGRALGALPAVETAAIVVNAQAGVELLTQRMMESAAENKLCRLIIINKIDAEDADLRGVLAAIGETFGKRCLPVNLPADGGKTVADCFFEPAEAVPDFSSVEEAHTQIVDQVIELDDELMELYLEHGEDISLDQLHDPFERALRRGHLIPVCFVSAATGAGLNQLLRVFSQLMPSPLEGNAPEFRSGEEEDAAPYEVDPTAADGHFLGHVFKINVDPYVGRLATFRVHQGEIRSGAQVFIGEQRKGVKLAHLYRVQGKNLEEVPAAAAGDICAVSKIEDIGFDDILHSSHDEDGLRMRPVAIPRPCTASPWN